MVTVVPIDHRHRSMPFDNCHRIVLIDNCHQTPNNAIVDRDVGRVTPIFNKALWCGRAASGFCDSSLPELF